MTKHARWLLSAVALASACERDPGNNKEDSPAADVLGTTTSSLPAVTGILDGDFDGDGKVVTAVGSGSDYAQAVALQVDGKIVVAGYSSNGTYYDFAVVRYGSDGSLDPTFDGDGTVTTSISSGNDYGRAVAVQADGKIVVAGSSYFSGTTSWDVALVRYNSDGSLDSTFDGDGKVTTSVGSSSELGQAIAIQNDGKIVVSGYASSSGILVIRYDSNGSLDPSFGGNGIAVTSLTFPFGTAVALQPDGKIVVAGHAYNGTALGSTYEINVLRYNSDGSPDTSFDSDGRVTTAIGTEADFGLAAAVQEDGKIVVAGYTRVTTNDTDIALIRYNVDGSLDTGFDGDGIVTTPVGSVGTSTDVAQGVAIQGDGKIVVAGTTGTSAIAVLRYDGNGALDSTFGENGIVTASVGSSTNYGKAVVLQSDGKIVVAGHAYNNGAGQDFAVLRFE